MKIVTFNVLCPKLCHPNQFLNYEADFLDEKKRIEKIKSFLIDWINDEYIILLQEVPISYRGNFECLFNENNYYLACSSYGNDYADNMGIAIAFPKNRFTLKDIDYIRVGSLIEKKQIYKPTGFLEKIYWRIYSTNFVKYFVKDEQAEINETYNIATYRKNIVIVVNLLEIETDKTFTVLNYHMPCTFNNPNIQLLHIQALKKIASRSKYPKIISGDFNITPSSDLYQYLIGNIPSNNSFLQDAKNVFQKYDSAYKFANDQEPEFTIYSNTKFGGLFKNTLDYIFLSDRQWKIINSKKYIETNTIMPNEICPSDHIPILAEIEII